jgi:hypothetical protein
MGSGREWTMPHFTSRGTVAAGSGHEGRRNASCVAKKLVYF